MYYLNQSYPKTRQRKKDNAIQLMGEESGPQTGEVLPRLTELARGRPEIRGGQRND